MPKFSTPSSYIKHQELSETEDTIVTIASFKQEEVGQGADMKTKWVIYFHELEKGLVLNATNGKTICKLYGEEMEEWVGKKIAIFCKDDIEYAGELVSGIRVRPKAPKG